MSTPPPERGGPVGRGLGRIVGRAVPAVLRNVDTEALLDSLDVDAVVAALDVNEVAERLDLDQLVDRLDVNKVAERLDLDALIERLDVNQIAARLDLDQLVDRLDVNKVAERLDLDALIERLDVNQIAARLDLDQLVDRLDVNKVAERLDLDALVQRIDVNQLAERLEISGVLDRVELVPLMSRGAEEVATSTLDLARRQVVRVDAVVSGIVDRLVGRDPERTPLGPPSLVREQSPIRSATPSRREVTGHYAGPVSRLGAYAADSVAAVASFGVLGAVLRFFVDVLTNRSAEVAVSPWVGFVLLGVWVFGWFWLPLALTGRSPAKWLVGLKVVRGDGSRIGAGRALVRVLVMPLSGLAAGLGLVGIVVGQRHRALHDVVADSAVVYDWGARRAEQPVPLLANLSARARRESVRPDLDDPR